MANETDWTKEPWSLIPHAKMNISAKDRNGVTMVTANCGGFSSTEYDVHDELHANAKRIVTCINECAGFEAHEIKEALKDYKEKCDGN